VIKQALPRDLITVGDAAARVRCCKRTVVRFIQRNNIPSWKRGPGRTATRLLRESDLARLLEPDQRSTTHAQGVRACRSQGRNQTAPSAGSVSR
jgi:excisionase family DNA binding protein